MTWMRPLRLIAGLAVLSGLTACITLLPEDKPAQLYRFGYVADPSQVRNVTKEARAESTTSLVMLSPPIFPKEAESDRILTSEGARLSYVARGRWAAPAPDLFAGALEEGLARGGQVRLSHSARDGARLFLTLTLHRFEVQYKDGKAIVVVDMDAMLRGNAKGTPLQTLHILETVPLEHNRINTIAEGFDTAVSRAIDEIATFVATTNDKNGA